MPVEPGEKCVKADVYACLFEINAAFGRIAEEFAVLRRHPEFNGRVLDRYVALSKETRAATSSFLTGVIEAAETQEAERRFAKRRARERADEAEP